MTFLEDYLQPASSTEESSGMRKCVSASIEQEEQQPKIHGREGENCCCHHGHGKLPTPVMSWGALEMLSEKPVRKRLHVVLFHLWEMSRTGDSGKKVDNSGYLELWGWRLELPAKLVWDFFGGVVVVKMYQNYEDVAQP